MPLVLAKRGEPDLGHHLAQRVAPPRRQSAKRAPGLRVEVDAQLVGVVVVGGAHRPRVEGHGVHLHGPHGGGHLVDDDLRVPPPARVAARDRAHPVGHALGRVLLVELLALDALGEPLQGDRPVADVVHERVADRDDVGREVALGDAGVGPHDPVGAAQAHLTRAVGPLDLQHLRVRHAASLTTCADDASAARDRFFEDLRVSRSGTRGPRAVGQDMTMKPTDRSYAVDRTEEEWKATLSPEEYQVLRQAGTERPYTGEYTDAKTVGVYACRACGAELFTSETKFDSHCGWPSFFSPLAGESVELLEDRSLPGRPRIEVRCATCGSHLGHVFEGEGYDTPTDQRYCINSISLTLRPADGAPTA